MADIRDQRVQVLLNAEEYIALQSLTGNGDDISHSAFFRNYLKEKVREELRKQQEQRAAA
jgi:hypothetical protein